MSSSFASPPTTIRVGDLNVTRLGFGAMQLPGPMVWGEPGDPEKARAVLRRVVELGMNVIDTAWFYGPLVSNRLIAETLYPYPQGLVIFTKLGGKRTPDSGWAPALRPEELRRGCEEDLRTLRLDRVDVAHLRWLDSDVPFAEALEAMIALQREGKVRHIALSNVSLTQIAIARGKVPIVAIQNMYNVAAGEGRLGNIPHMVVREQEAIVDLCATADMAFLPFFPLAIPGPARPKSQVIADIAQRHGITESQVAIAWLLARSPAMLPIPGTSSPEHLAENWAARNIALPPEDLAAITDSRR